MSNGIIPKLCAIQSALKSPKDQKAQKYRYRNIEAVNEAVKPLAAAQGCAVTYADNLEVVDGHVVCTSTCTITDGEDRYSSQAFALVNTKPQNMSVEQACGAASSYARKYAACGLFAIDDSRDDPDRTNAKGAEKPKADDLSAAKVRLANACKAYADMMGSDAKTIMSGVMERPDYEANKDNAGWFAMVAEEFESETK